MRELYDVIDALYEAGEGADSAEAREAIARLIEALERGQARAARPGQGGDWIVEPSVKRGILLAFRHGVVRPIEGGGALSFSDKDTLLPRRLDPDRDGVRVVPGGSSVRAGAYLGPGAVVMPPAYINVGAWVGPGAMIDSHALVGSCAQVGAGVHLSAGAQLGGVLEPIGQAPVIIEEGVMVGGLCGVFEGVRVGKNAVLGAGVLLTGSTRVYDLVHETELDASEGLAIPPSAVVVPGTRPASGAWAAERGLQAGCALIVKYRDERTDARTALERALRPKARSER